MRMRHVGAIATGMLVATAATAIGARTAGAQTPTPASPGGIVVTASGETQVRPDRAMIFFAVETRAQTAAAAGRDNARRQQQVLDTLRKMGIPAEQLSTVGYSVSPEMSYTENRPRVIGYVARNTVRVEVRQMEQVGAIIDAGLARGANVVSSLRFFSSKAGEARRDALTDAVRQARLEAEALAQAAGGSLGALIEMTSMGEMERPMMQMDMAMARTSAASAETPVEPGEQTVRAMVVARWAFVPGAR